MTIALGLTEKQFEVIKAALLCYEDQQLCKAYDLDDVPENERTIAEKKESAKIAGELRDMVRTGGRMSYINAVADIRRDCEGKRVEKLKVLRNKAGSEEEVTILNCLIDHPDYRLDAE